MNFILKLLNLKKFSEEELCDIYFTLINFEWDKRLGKKPIRFDKLRDKRNVGIISISIGSTKEDLLKPYINEIEHLTSNYERCRYQKVILTKQMTEEEFKKWWGELGKQ